MNSDHIHTPEDGRGKRNFYLNGKEVKYCVMADTDKGVVEHYDDPPKLAPSGNEIIRHTARGDVKVIQVGNQ